MKIEKLTENKIRIVVNSTDIELNNLNVNYFTKKTLEKQTFFIDLLKKAKNEIGFDTDGYKLFIETFSTSDDFLVFTITKYSSTEIKKPIVKRKFPKTTKNHSIYSFNSFEEFCEFCCCINNLKNFDCKLLSKNIDLYYYQNTYYLLIKDINDSYINKTIFFSLISEFSIYISSSSTFENKLIEYGNLIVKKNALNKVIKYFI